MKKTILFAMVSAGFIGLVGCSSNPDVQSPEQPKKEVASENMKPKDKGQEESKDKDQETPKAEASTIEVKETGKDSESEAEAPTDEHYLTKLTWTPVEFMPGRGLSAVLEDHGIESTWVDDLSTEDHLQMLSWIEGQSFHVIDDAQGQVLDVYGESERGDYFRVSRQEGSYTLLEQEGFASEITVKLSVRGKKEVSNLGQTQQLVMKRFYLEMSKDDPEGLYSDHYIHGDVDLSFKALFMGGRMIGPTDIVEAKARFKGQELMFKPD